MADEEVIRKFLVEIGYKTDTTSQQRALSSIEMMTGVLGKLAGAAAIAFGVGKVIQFNNALAQTAAQADKLGTTIQGLERLGKAAEIGGGSIAGLQTAMRGFADFIKNAPGSGQWLERWLPGVSRDATTGFLKDAQGRVVDQLEAMKRFIAELNKSPGFDLATKLNIAKTAGIGADEYFALTNKSVQELEASLKKIDDTFLGDPSAYIENARKFKTEFDQLTRTLADLYTRMLGEESGALVGPLKDLNNYLQAHGPEIVKTVDTIAEAFKIVGGDIAEISHDIAAANTALQGFANTVAETIAPLTNKLHGVGGIGTKEGPARWLKHGLEELFGVSSAHAEGVAGDDLKAQQRADTVIKNTDALKALTEKLDKMASDLARAFESRTQQEHEAAGMGMSGGGSGAGVSGGTSPGPGGGGASPASGGGGATPYAGPGSPVTKNLRANQQEAYNAARKLGYSDEAARAMVANFTGESLANPANKHWDLKHYSQGIAQWDDARSQRIKNKFGKYPAQMTVSEQVAAFKWETDNYFPNTARALQGNNSAAMVDTLVRNFERPAAPDRDVGIRLGHLRRLEVNPNGGAPQTASTPIAPRRTLPDITVRNADRHSWNITPEKANLMMANASAFAVPNTRQPLGHTYNNHTDSHARTQNVNFGPFTTQVHLAPGGQQPAASSIAVGVESGMRKHLATVLDNLGPRSS